MKTKDQWSAPQIQPEATTAPTSETPRSSEKGLDRRNFLEFALRAAAVGAVAIATEGCGALNLSRREVERRAELLNKHEAFIKRWQNALEAGIKKMEDDPELIAKYGEKEIKKLSQIFRAFDVKAYIGTLAKIGKVRAEEINGEILDFEAKPSDSNGAMAAVEEMRHMKVYVGEWMRWENSWHAPTVHAAMRHELAHMFSFNYETTYLTGRIPWVYQPQSEGWEKRMHVGNSIYEGCTEVIALYAALAGEGPKSVEQGYRGGGTLSAYVLAELVGREGFVQAYVRRDTELLAALLDAKVDKWAKNRLTLPVNMALDLGDNYNTSLDLLHQAFVDKDISPARLQDILQRAQSDGVQERAAHFDGDRISLTMHLFALNDADDPTEWQVNGVGKAPSVYRFGKLENEISVSYGNGKSKKERYLVQERFGFFIVSKEFTDAEQERITAVAAELLKKHCENKEPNSHSLTDAHVIIGIDRFVTEKLEQLNMLTATNSGDTAKFESIWKEINDHMRKRVKKIISEVYEQAGVKDLMVPDREK